MNRQKHRIISSMLGISLIFGTYFPCYTSYATEVSQPSTLSQQELLNIIQTSYDNVQIRSSIENVNLGLNLTSYNTLREDYKSQLINRLINTKYSYTTYDTVQAVQDFINTEINNIAIEQAKLDEYPITFADGETADCVKSNIGLPAMYNNGGASLMWEISNTSIISYNGMVARAENDETVTLIGHSYVYSIGYIVYTTRTIKVIGTNTDAVKADGNDLNIQYSNSDTKDNVTTNIDLPQKGPNGTIISWQSDKASIIDNNGIVNKPTGKDESVNLTATITKGTSSTTKTFQFIVKGVPQIETPPVTNNGGTTQTPPTTDNGGTTQPTPTTDNGGKTQTPPSGNSGSNTTIDNNTSPTPVVVELPKTEGSNGEISSTAKVGAIKDGKDTLVIKTDEITMSVPESAINVGSLNPDDYVKISQAVLPSNQADELYKVLPSNVKPLKNIISFTMQLFDNGNNLVRDIHQFANNKKVNIGIKLTDSQISGIDTSKLSMYYYDETAKQWVDLGGSFDKSAMTFNFATPHFTKFAIMQKVDTATAVTSEIAKLPQTGSAIDFNVVLEAGLMFLAAGSCLFFFFRKKRI